MVAMTSKQQQYHDSRDHVLRYSQLPLDELGHRIRPITTGPPTNRLRVAVASLAIILVVLFAVTGSLLGVFLPKFAKQHEEIRHLKQIEKEHHQEHQSHGGIKDGG